MPAKQTIVVRTVRSKTKVKKSSGGSSNKSGNRKRCSSCGRFL
nr:MAG TPA: zinc ribbon domain protein [Bacteriophage sp.]